MENLGTKICRFCGHYTCVQLTPKQISDYLNGEATDLDMIQKIFGSLCSSSSNDKEDKYKEIPTHYCNNCHKFVAYPFTCPNCKNKTLLPVSEYEKEYLLARKEHIDATHKCNRCGKFFTLNFR